MPSESAVARLLAQASCSGPSSGRSYIAATFTIIFASRYPNAVARSGTRAIAPPRTRSWAAASGAVEVSRCSRIASAAPGEKASRRTFVPAANAGGGPSGPSYICG